MRTWIYGLTTCFAWLGLACAPAPTPQAIVPAVRVAVAPGAEARPILALWEEPHDPGPPGLRFAIWADGRVVSAVDPTRWDSGLRRGKIDPARVEALKTQLAASGVFDLQGTCYLVPGAPTDHLLVDLGDKQQMLFWDEREMPGYGINIDPKPHHREFIRCWKAVNQLGLAVLPPEAKPVAEPFVAPKSWYLKLAIQSE